MNVTTVEQAVTLLNKIIKIDPTQLSNFFNSHTLVDKRCANSLFELAPSFYKEYAELYPLGLINGFVSESDEEGRIVKRIGVAYKPESPIIDHFYVDDLRERQNDPELKES